MRRSERMVRFRDAISSGRVDETLERAYDAVIEAAGEELDLQTEIGGLRILLHRAMAFDALDSDAYEAGELVAELVGSITRAMRAQRRLAGASTDDLAIAVDRVLDDLGLGDDH